MDWLHQLPTVLLGALVVGATTAFGCAGVALTRRWTARRAPPAEITAAFVATVGVGHAVLAALVALASWESRAAVEENVAGEAAAVARLVADAALLPPDQARQLTARALAYASHVAQVEWEEQRRGGVESAEGDRLVGSLLQAWRTHSPASDDDVLRAALLADIDQLAELRHARLDAIDVGVHATTWVVLVLGTLVLIATTFAFRMEALHHQLLTAGLCVLLGLLLVLIASLDRPLLGPSAISPAPFEDVSRAVGGGSAMD